MLLRCLVRDEFVEQNFAGNGCQSQLCVMWRGRNWPLVHAVMWRGRNWPQVHAVMWRGRNWSQVHAVMWRGRNWSQVYAVMWRGRNWSQVHAVMSGFFVYRFETGGHRCNLIIGNVQFQPNNQQVYASTPHHGNVCLLHSPRYLLPSYSVSLS